MKTQPHVGVIGSVGVPARYGGFETLAHELVLHLNDSFDFTIYCSAPAYPKEERKKTWQGAKLVHLPLEANGWQSVFYDGLALLHALRRCDLLVVLGVSGCLFLPLIRLFSSKPLIVHIDGLEWRRKKWGKFARAYLHFAERMAAKYADVLVADNQGIKDYVQEAYQQEAALIAYGGDQVHPVAATPEGEEAYSFLGKPYAFTVCRIEPENHIDLLLEVFSRFEGYPLAVVGNWQHSLYGQELYKRYSGCRNLFLLDPIYEPSVLNMLRSNAYVYLHGHEAGGTNPSLVEAMNLALPVVAYDVVYNRETTEGKALYFHSADELLARLEEITPTLAAQLSSEMLDIARRRYQWSIVADQYQVLWQQVLQAHSPKIASPLSVGVGH